MVTKGHEHEAADQPEKGSKAHKQQVLHKTEKWLSQGPDVVQENLDAGLLTQDEATTLRGFVEQATTILSNKKTEVDALA